LWKLRDLQRKGMNTEYLQRKIDCRKLTKPVVKNLNVELDSRFVDIRESTGGAFDLFIQVEQIGNKKKLRLPIKHTRVSRKWLTCGKLKPSVRVNNENLVLYFEVPEAPLNGSRTLGADQGLTTTLSLSDGQVTKANKDGYDLAKITRIIARRQKGSHRFAEAVSHRKNYVNWSLNQLNFKGVKQVNFEKIHDLRRGRKASRYLSHWCYPLIKQKLVRLSEDKGFLFVEQDNRFRSQRCARCGWVHKSNRKGKTFRCTNTGCDYFADSDLNAASNHEIVLPAWNQEAWQQHLNRTSGFFWNPDVTQVAEGREPIVPDTQKAGIHIFQ